MDVIITCHTEFGYVTDKNIVLNKNAKEGVSLGVLNLIKLADKYRAKVSFAVCPETVPYFPKNISHEVGLHIHPGWNEFNYKQHSFFVGDEYLKKHCQQSINSSILPDFSYQEQLGMIKEGKRYIESELGVGVKTFVAGRWSLNNDTMKALVETGFTHELSAPAHSISDHYDWLKLPRICMPYHPNKTDYQKKGDLPLLEVPIAQTLFGGTVNPEGIVTYGLPWLLACFKEYHRLGVPLFHICLHSPSMTDPYYQSVMEKILQVISSHKDVTFKFASEIREYPEKKYGTNIMPYFAGVNKELLQTALARFKNLF